LSEPKNFKSISGQGIKVDVDGKSIVKGNEKLMEKEKIDISKLLKQAEAYAKEGNTPIYVAIDGKSVGIIAIADTVKSDSKSAIKKFENSLVDVYMVTGDNAETALAIAKKAGIKSGHILSEVAPKDKEKKVKELQKKALSVAMVGDGINDAPALATANVGIAMGTGTDIAMETGQITIMNGSLDTHLYTLSRD